MNIILAVLTIAALASFPVSFVLEKKHGFGKRARLYHVTSAIVGSASVLAVYLIFLADTGSAESDVAAWAEDFFCGYCGGAVKVMLVLTAILAVSYAIDHPMRRVRATLTMLLPLAIVLITLFVAYTASGGEIPVDSYIRWLAPGFALMSHYGPVFTRTGKKKED